MHSRKQYSAAFFLLVGLAAIGGWTAEAQEIPEIQVPDIVSVDHFFVRSTSMQSLVNVTAGTNMTLFNVSVEPEGGPPPTVSQVISGDTTYAVTITGLEAYNRYSFQFQLVMIGNESIASRRVPVRFVTAPAIVDIHINRIAPHSVYSLVNVTVGADLEAYNVIVIGDHGPIPDVDQEFNGTSAYAVAVHDMLPLTNNTLKYILNITTGEDVFSDEVIQRITTGPALANIGFITVYPHSVIIRVDVTPGADMAAYLVVVTGADGSVLQSETTILDVSSYSVDVHNLLPTTNYSLNCDVKMIADPRVYSGQGAANFMTSAGINDVGLIAAQTRSADIRVNVSLGARMTDFKVVVVGSDGSIFPTETDILDASSFMAHVTNLVPSNNYTLSAEVQLKTDSKVHSGLVDINFMTKTDDSDNTISIAIGSTAGVAVFLAIIAIVGCRYRQSLGRRRGYDPMDGVN